VAGRSSAAASSLRPAGNRASELRSFLRGERGRFYDVNPEGPVDYRTLVKGTSTAGGNTVPTGFYDRLIAHLIEVSAIMQAGATILNTNSGEVIQVPKTTAHSSAAIVTEGNSIGVSDPAFGQVPLGAYKYGTMIQVSRELLDDTGVDLEGYLAMQAGRALGQRVRRARHHRHRHRSPAVSSPTPRSA
jgi:HK97 family phage major capsid protein